jgi:hypothetical protein
MPTLASGDAAVPNRHAGFTLPPMTADQRWNAAQAYFAALGITDRPTVRWLITGPGPTAGPAWLT